MPGTLDTANFSPQNPDWIVKSVGDKQTAVEMNEVIEALKNNAQVLQNLINKVAPGTALDTTAQLHANAINELKALYSAGMQTPSWIHISPGAVWNFPAMQKGEARAFWIQSPNDNISQPEGIVYVGGYTGIQVGHQGLVVCLDTNDGGSYGEVGHKFLVMGGRHSPGVVRKPNLGEFPDPGKVGVFYIATTTGLVYLWMEGYGDPPTDQYVAISSEIPGRLINSTTFHDLDDLPVVPQVGEIYRDVDTEIYYTWDGVKFSELGGGSGGSGTPNFAYLNDQQYVKYSEATGRLESGKISETPAGIDVNGSIKAQAVELENEPGTPLPNQITRNGKKAQYTNDVGVTENIQVGSNVFVYTPTSNFTISAIKAGMETAGKNFNDCHIIIALGSNNYTCSIDLNAPNYIFTLERRGSGSISFSSTRTLNSGVDEITILNGNESSMALIDCGTTTDFLKIRNF